MFVGDLCLALGRTLAEVDAMSAAEFAFWRVYAARRGLPTSRIEGATAVGAAYLGRQWGGRKEPAELLPHFGPRQQNLKVLAAQLARLPGATVQRIPRPDRAAQRERERAGEPKPKPASRVLNPKR